MTNHKMNVDRHKHLSLTTKEAKHQFSAMQRLCRLCCSPELPSTGVLNAKLVGFWWHQIGHTGHTSVLHS